MHKRTSKTFPLLPENIIVPCYFPDFKKKKSDFFFHILFWDKLISKEKEFL